MRRLGIVCAGMLHEPEDCRTPGAYILCHSVCWHAAAVSATAGYTTQACTSKPSNCSSDNCCLQPLGPDAVNDKAVASTQSAHPAQAWQIKDR
jgi:hypothetical protein